MVDMIPHDAVEEPQPCATAAADTGTSVDPHLPASHHAALSTSLAEAPDATKMVTAHAGSHVQQHAAAEPADLDTPVSVAEAPAPAVAEAASTVPAAASAPGMPAADDWGDDDFGEFDAAPAVSVPQPSSTVAPAAAPAAAAACAPQETTPSSSAAAGAATAAPAQEDDDDDFGDFGDATSFAGATAASSSSSAAAAAVPAPPAAMAAPAAVQQQPPAAAVPEGPDILQLSGQNFLAAVLEAWQVLDAPAAHAAAVAQQPSAASLQQPQAIQVQLPQLHQQCQQEQVSRVMAHCGLPLNGNSIEQQQQHDDLGRLQWHGSVSEGRLVELLGLSQAVKRARAALSKDQAAAAPAAGGTGSGAS